MSMTMLLDVTFLVTFALKFRLGISVDRILSSYCVAVKMSQARSRNGRNNILYNFYIKLHIFVNMCKKITET
jgi:hypothetical protein